MPASQFAYGRQDLVETMKVGDGSCEHRHQLGALAKVEQLLTMVDSISARLESSSAGSDTARPGSESTAEQDPDLVQRASRPAATIEPRPIKDTASGDSAQSLGRKQRQKPSRSKDVH